MKQFIVLFLCVFLVSCVSQQKKCERFVAKYPKCFKNDTTIIHDTTKSTDIVILQKLYIDTLLLNHLLDSLNKLDTCITINDIKSIAQSIPIKVKPYFKETDRYTVSSKIVNNKIVTNVHIKEQIKEIVVPPKKPTIIIPAAEKPLKETILDSLFWFLLGAATLAIILVFNNRKPRKGYYV